jgi:electron transport complex protein RnfG
MIRLTLVLALVTFAASLALGLVYQSTAEKIEEQARINEEKARKIALPKAACGVFTQEKSGEMEYYMGYRYPDTTGFVGYVVKAEGQGYSSTIETVVGLDPRGHITGLKIINQQETPGLGTRIEEVKSTKTVLDAIQEMVGQGAAEKICVDVEADTAQPCVEVELLEAALCGDIEKGVVEGDTAGVVALVPQAFGLTAEDSAACLTDAESAFELAEKVTEELRSRTTPWFLKQFVGKSAGSLLVTSEKTDQHIQAITGATISSVAVAKSVREAIKSLEGEIGGFEEVVD